MLSILQAVVEEMPAQDPVLDLVYELAEQFVLAVGTDLEQVLAQ